MSHLPNNAIDAKYQEPYLCSLLPHVLVLPTVEADADAHSHMPYQGGNLHRLTTRTASPTMGGVAAMHGPTPRAEELPPLRTQAPRTTPSPRAVPDLPVMISI
jgi:hypothetical protein